MVRAAFFDIDGTLLSFRTHEVPESAIRALQALRERGVKLFVATGRSPDEMPTGALHLFERIPFDAYLLFSGHLCYDDAGVYRDEPIDEHDVRVIAGQVAEGRYDAIFMQRTRIFANRHTDRVREVERNLGTEYPDGSLDGVFDQPTYQLCAFVDPGEEHLFMDGCAHVEHARWCDGFCDIFPAGGGKQPAVLATLERYGIAPEEAVAFGDGGNDLPMFACVGRSVAMGNAGAEVKAAATDVTDNVDDDGVLRACERLGLV